MNQKRVLEVAAALFLEKGFAYTSMDELVRVSKVSKSNVYYHFADKEELLAGVVDYWIETYERAMDEILSRNQLSVEERVQMFLEHLSQEFSPESIRGAVRLLRSIFKLRHKLRTSKKK